MAFASLFFSRLSPVAFIAENLQIERVIRAAIFERKDVVNVCVFSIRDSQAGPACVRITHQHIVSRC